MLTLTTCSRLTENSISYASSVPSLKFILRSTIEDLAKRKATAESIHVVPLALNRTVFGIHVKQLRDLNMKEFKRMLLASTKAKKNQYTQFVGDTTTQFTPEGTIAARTFMEPYILAAGMIGYGFTGYKKEEGKRLDGNSILSTIFEEKPALGSKAVANIVAHNVVALEKWGCWVTENVGTYVVVYNDAGMEEGFTKFGADVPVSDGIMTSADEDLLIMTEGGPQSFLQACNALRLNVPIKALYGLRMPENLVFFSATEFFALVQEALRGNSALKPEDVRAILDDYLKTHKAWNPTAVDADTKAAQFYKGVEVFWSEGLYCKLLKLVEIQKLG